MKTQQVFFYISLVVALISSLLIVLSTTRLSQTHDESGHIASGLEWLQGSYVLSPQNPPLSRLGAAILPYLDGVRIVIPADLQENFIKYSGYAGIAQQRMEATGGFREELILARLGVLPFFLLSLLLVFLLGRRLGGRLAGSLAVILLATLPVVLAHSGLATTDVPSMATYLLATYLLIRWLEMPSLKNAAWLGVGMALAITTKFTALLFILPLLFIFYGLRYLRYRQPNGAMLGKGLMLGLLSFLLTIWAVYQFSFGRVGDLPDDVFLLTFNNTATCYASDPLVGFIHRLYLPAPEFFKGLADTWCFNKVPFPGYLLGEFRPTGSTWFYVIALAVKTPLATLALFLATIFFSIRYRLTDWRLLGIFAAIGLILMLSFISNLNIGVRHVIQLYPFIALLIGVAATRLIIQLDGLQRQLAYAIVGILLFSQLQTAYLEFPYWLSYFNIFGGKEPGKFIVDSDLDWGQGMYALEEYFADKPIDTLHVAIFHTYPLCHYALPPLKLLAPTEEVKGWIAICEFAYRKMMDWGPVDFCENHGFIAYDVPFGQRYAWLRAYSPVAKVGGGSIRIYYIE